MPSTLDVEITGDKHPKEVTLVSDDHDALNATLIEQFRESDFDDLAQQAEDNPQGEDGKLRIKVDSGDIGSVIDFVEASHYGSPAQTKLEEMREDAYSQAEEALSGGDDDGEGEPAAA